MYYQKFGGFAMRVCYDKLFHLMIDRKLTTSQLMKKCGFSANIIARLKKNEYISMESLGKLCKELDCKVDDILTFEYDES
jgi:putative transcriptional regulator